MVDKELNFLSKNEKYGVVENNFSTKENTIGKITYLNGEPLKYGDEAEIFGVLNLEEEFKPFMQSALTDGGYYKEHYSFIFGYQPADFENEEISEDKVKIHYAGVDNTISKTDFFELCLLLCDAKLNRFNPNKNIDVGREELISIKSKLQEKIKYA